MEVDFLEHFNIAYKCLLHVCAIIPIKTYICHSESIANHCRFIPANLENMFSKYARTVPDKLTLKELWHMTEGCRNAFDFFSWSLSLYIYPILYPWTRIHVYNNFVSFL